MTKTVSAEQAASALRRLVRALSRTSDLERRYATAVLHQAQGLAASRPTPQSRMAAEGMGVRSGEILSLSGGPPGEVAEGSEFGSGIYRQFGPRNPRGYWLLPSAESPDASTIAEGEDWIDETVEGAIRGF